MRFPLSISDISLWLAVTAVILLTASELLSSSTDVVIEKKGLRLVALALGIGFMITVIVRVFQPI